MNRFYKQDGNNTLISTVSVPGYVELTFNTDQDFLDGGNPTNIVWDGQTPRLINDTEKIPGLIATLHNEIDLKTEFTIRTTEFTYNHDSIDYIVNTGRKDIYFQNYLILETNEYPQDIKAKGDNYMTFDAKADHKAFILAGAAVIRDIVLFGRVLKYGGDHQSTTYIGVYNMTFQQLIDFVDPRI